MATSDYFTRKASTGRIRPSIAAQAPIVSSPTTPQTPILSRSYSSALNSPSTGFRSTDDEPLVVELGSRYMRAGLAGEKSPRCILDFSPDQQRRAGDYRQWLPGNIAPHHVSRFKKRWGCDHELWRMDTRHVDLGLVEDKIERAFWTASTKYLMDTPSKPRRIFLALPPTLPHALLTATLTTLFVKAQAPSITLLPTPVLNTVAAGLRSALVVDIGWSETIVTAVYEYREVYQTRSDRGAKTLCQEFGQLLDNEIGQRNAAAGESNVSENSADGVTFELAEEVMTRIGWCKSADRVRKEHAGQETQLDAADSTVHIPIQAHNPAKSMPIPFNRLAEPVEIAWFARGSTRKDLDDNELSLHELAFNALLALPMDIRAICMSRIVVAGGGSRLPGIKRRLIDEIDSMVRLRGWDPIRNYGSISERRNRVKHVAHANSLSQTISQWDGDAVANGASVDTDPARLSSSVPPIAAVGYTDQEHDPIVEKLRTRQKPPLQGIVRGVETLGAFAGLAILSKNGRGIVEIERDSYLQHGGLASASRTKDVTVAQTGQRTSLGPGVGGGVRTSWTLAGWA
ncbi:MAG: hypothetical protein M1820_003569 [Bogoriella megaspora]|nr:MAG: hypothetical protein M1820_003569 [Bogoriella megaspora]